MERCCVQAVTALHSGGFNAVAKAGKRVPHNSLATWAARWKSGSCSCLTAGSSVIYLDWWAFCIKFAWSPHVFVCEAYFWKYILIYVSMAIDFIWFHIHLVCVDYVSMMAMINESLIHGNARACARPRRVTMTVLSWTFDSLKKKSLCESCRFVFLVPRNSQKT